MLDVYTTIGAVTLNVADLPTMADFYTNIIGLQVHIRAANMVTLGTALRPLIHLRYLRNGRFHTNTTGLYHFALRVPTRQDLANWLQHYAKLEAPFWQGAADHGVSEALYLRDPEGNGIEVYWDRPKTMWPLDNNGALTMFTHALDLQKLLQIADNNNWSGIASGTTMGHIHLKVADITTAEQFYVNTLGFNAVIEMPGSALFVAAGDYHHHIGLNTWHSRQAPPAPTDAYGLAQFELLFSDQTALQNTLVQLKQVNYPIEDSNTDSVIHAMAHAMVHDPFDIPIVLRAGS